MSRKVATFVGLVAITLTLAIVFWIVNITIAPHIFFFFWRNHQPHEASPLVLAGLAAIAPLIVAIPFGVAFGLLLSRGPMVVAFLVAIVAAGLNLAHSAWAYVSLGHAFFDSRTWVNLLDLTLFVILFVAAATLATRAASQWRERQRLLVGRHVWVTLTATTLVSAYLWYQSTLESARAA